MASLTVTIPTINRALCLLRTVQLLSQQTVRPIEIIVVDQTERYSVPDRSLIEQVRSTPSVHYYLQSEPNASKARNLGLLRGAGDIILFLDDDVDFGPSLIESHLKNYISPTVPGVAGQVRTEGRVRNDKHPLSVIPRVGWIVFPFNYTQACLVESGMAGNLSVRRSLAMNVGGMDEVYQRGGFREEADFCYRFVRRFGKLQFDPDAWVDSLAWPEGGIRSASAGIADSNHLACEYYFIFKNLSPVEQAVHILYSFYRRWYLRPAPGHFLGTAIPQALTAMKRAWHMKTVGPRYIQHSALRQTPSEDATATAAAAATEEEL